MKKIKLSQRAKHAILIGGLCSVSYLAVYIARNVLGAVSPKMELDGFSTADITTMGSAFFFSYGIGQLINGIIGDKIKARYMISFGLLFAGITNILFAIFAASPVAALVSYIGTGFFLAMIYGPMTKVVSENTDPIHATRCSLGYTFASFMGSPMAGILATVFSWKNTFLASSIALIAMAVIVFCAFILLEKKGIVKYGQYKRDKKSGGSIKVLIKHNIIKFAIIAILTGVIRTSVVQLLTLYFKQYLGFSESDAPLIYSAATLVMASTTFISIFVYERLKRNMNLTMLIMFAVSTVFFFGVFLVKHTVINIIFIVIAIMASNGAATMLWSRYCPSLYETGMVSSATGFLDFLSYMSAAVANVLFGRAIDGFELFGHKFDGIGWKNLILVWFGIVLLGLIVSLPYDKIFRGKKGADGKAELEKTFKTN